MRIHELLEQPLADYTQQLIDDFNLTEVSWYQYKPVARPQLKRAMQVARKTTSRIKKTGGKAKSIAKRAGHSATKAAASNAMKQQAALKQKQTQQSTQAAKAYQPIKYPKQMVMPRKLPVALAQSAVQQPKPTPAPPSVTTKVSNLSDLQNLGAQAHRLLPNDKRGTPPWELHND
jgi:ABC-type proline/glycine betaine transport system ATPase subunit